MNRIGQTAPVFNSRPTDQTRAGAQTETGPSDGLTLSGADWQWGDPLSALPARKESNPLPAGWTWGDPLSALPEKADPPAPVPAPKTTPLEAPSTPSGWHWGDPLPSW
ncbi:hypothetical protein JST97_09255 [bacterium]|nr:hypothetical protein [bacterium]